MKKWALVAAFIGINLSAVGCNVDGFSGSTLVGKSSGTKAKQAAKASAESFYPASTPSREILTDYLSLIEERYGDSSYVYRGFEFANMQTFVTDLLEEPKFQVKLDEITAEDIMDRDQSRDEEILEAMSNYSLNYSGMESQDNSEPFNLLGGAPSYVHEARRAEAEAAAAQHGPFAAAAAQPEVFGPNQPGNHPGNVDNFAYYPDPNQPIQPIQPPLQPAQ